LIMVARFVYFYLFSLMPSCPNRRKKRPLEAQLQLSTQTSGFKNNAILRYLNETFLNGPIQASFSFFLPFLVIIQLANLLIIVSR